MSTKLTKKLSEKELKILRQAIDEAEKKRHKYVTSPLIKKIFHIVEKFIKDNNFICYGGTAINNILPEHDQFYDKDIELPDYDFFSPNALVDAKKLANIYYDIGFDEVEAKAGVHIGTYKVFVNFIPIADITQLDNVLYQNLKKNAIMKNGILYAPPNYLRMSAYLELSRPDGDVTRWEKVLKRLILLNKHYPLSEKQCNIAHFIRKFEEPIGKDKTIYKIVQNNIIKQKLIFFGGFAIYSYGKYLSQKERNLLLKYPDFDVLANDPENAAKNIKNALNKANILDVNIIKHSGIGEFIASHYEIRVGPETIAFIYKPLACHSYNTIRIHNKLVNIASIDTMLSLYLAFLYADRPYYDPHRILCLCQYLFMVQAKNRLQQKGVLKRFSTKCYGKQLTLEKLRAEKALKFDELKYDICSKEYQKYFLRYIPARKSICETIKTKTKKTKTKKTKTKKTKTKKTKKTKNRKVKK